MFGVRATHNSKRPVVSIKRRTDGTPRKYPLHVHRLQQQGDGGDVRAAAGAAAVLRATERAAAAATMAVTVAPAAGVMAGEVRQNVALVWSEYWVFS